MAHAEKLSKDILHEVAKQIGALAPGVIDREALNTKQLTTDETPFEVWSLGADALLQPTYDLRRLATRTGQWHHQVGLGNAATAFARSTPLGAQPSSWRVLEFFESTLAEKIAAAARWIDDEKNVPGDPLVRLLEVPTYQVHAFWLLREEGEDQVFVITGPEGLTHLSPNRLLTQRKFIEALRSEQHIIGRIRS